MLSSISEFLQEVDLLLSDDLALSHLILEGGMHAPVFRHVPQSHQLLQQSLLFLWVHLG